MVVNSKKAYSPNSNSARPAATTTTCRPSTVNEIGADLVFPPSERRQTSRPVSASNAKQTPPDAPNTNPPSVASRPLYSRSDVDELYSHFRWPLAASSARTKRIGGSVWFQPLPIKSPFLSCTTLFGACFVN